MHLAIGLFRLRKAGILVVNAEFADQSDHHDHRRDAAGERKHRAGALFAHIEVDADLLRALDRLADGLVPLLPRRVVRRRDLLLFGQGHFAS